MLEVLRRGKLKWSGHVEWKTTYDWMSAYRNTEVTAVLFALHFSFELELQLQL